MRPMLLWCVASAFLGAGWLLIPNPDLAAQCWEVEVYSSGPSPTETWHVQGAIEADSEGFLFTCREHGRIRVERFFVVGIRPGKTFETSAATP